MIALLGLILASCTTGADSASSSSTNEPVPTMAPTTTAARDCTPKALTDAVDLPSDPTAAATTMSRAVFGCSDTVVVSTGEAAALASAARLAIDAEAPLLVATEERASEVDEELQRLEPERVLFVGSATDVVLSPDDAEVIEPDGQPLTLDELTTGVEPASPIWVVAESGDPAALAALPAILAGGGTVVEPDKTDRDDVDPTAGPDAIAVIGELTPTEQWELLAPLVAEELPGGGVELFPGRRILAYYGSPVTFRLGLLGERSPERTLERIRADAEEYQIEGGDPVLPGFEMIATVADRKPGDDGDYSNELTLEEMQPWIDLATAEDVFVIIDLQPGRTDFLTQARRYEEFLRLPNVGLALDPEWRLEPDEVHLRQIGSVDAVEVNAVVDYLAGLVREEQLPQKVLVLHQFNVDMITNREAIGTPPELAVVVHADGQGPLGSKYGTWDTLIDAPIGPDQELWWGWKNFIDEDFPTARPGQVNAVEPLPVVITFQ